MSCTHGFVVPQAGGFLCKECDEKFAKYPRAVNGVNTPALAPPEGVLRSFHDGMVSFSETIKRTTFSLDEFTQAMREMYPPEAIEEIYDIIGGAFGDVHNPVKITTGYTPTRVSCFKEVEDFINNPDTTVTEVRAVMEKFGDITEVELLHHAVTDTDTLMITFNDGSRQRVDIQIPMLLKQPNGTKHTKFTPSTHSHLRGRH